MNVYELKQMLEECDEEATVKIVLDQFMPMEYQVGNAQEVDAIEEIEDEESGRILEEIDEDSAPTLYLVTGNQTGYLAGIYCRLLYPGRCPENADRAGRPAPADHLDRRRIHTN